MNDESPGAGALDEGYEPDLMTLQDEDGGEHTFEVLDAADMGEARYLAVVPYQPSPAKRLAEDAQMLVMRLGEQDGEEVLDIVEDEEELNAAGRMFARRLRDVYDIDMDELVNQPDGGQP
jgi:uncharacterized protein YrzB (UPF0473 family)